MLLGIWLLTAAWQLALQLKELTTLTRPPTHWTFWLFVLLVFYVTPYVINIGFSLNLKRWPQWVLLGGAALLVLGDFLLYGTWWAPPLGTFVGIWMLYASLHLGISFVLSSAIRTPGCEMRAIPHLHGLVTGRASKEHYCPGPLDQLDAWERRRS